VVGLLTACSADDSESGSAAPTLSVTDAWTRAVAPGGESAITTAVYFTIENDSGADDQLLSVTTAVAEAAEMHGSTITNGVMQMRRAQTVELPAGETVVFEPGGLHVMLIGVREPLEAGDRIDLELTFAQSGTMTVTVEVREL
jgi:copper(I)-binding protein